MVRGNAAVGQHDVAINALNRLVGRRINDLRVWRDVETWRRYKIIRQSVRNRREIDNRVLQRRRLLLSADAGDVVFLLADIQSRGFHDEGHQARFPDDKGLENARHQVKPAAFASSHGASVLVDRWRIYFSWFCLIELSIVFLFSVCRAFIHMNVSRWLLLVIKIIKYYR